MLANGHTEGANNVPPQDGANRRSTPPEGYSGEYLIREHQWIVRVQVLNRQHPDDYVQISDAMQNVPGEPPTTPVEVGVVLSALAREVEDIGILVHVTSEGLQLLGPSSRMTASQFHAVLISRAPHMIWWEQHESYSMALKFVAVRGEDRSTGSSEVSPTTRVNGVPNGVEH